MSFVSAADLYEGGASDTSESGRSVSEYTTSSDRSSEAAVTDSTELLELVELEAAHACSAEAAHWAELWELNDALGSWVW